MAKSNTVGTPAKKDFSTGKILLLDHIRVLVFVWLGPLFTQMSIYSGSVRCS